MPPVDRATPTGLHSKEESRCLFQGLGWAVTLGHNGGCDTASKDRQDLYLHPSSFSGVIDEANIEALQEQLSKAQTFHCKRARDSPTLHPKPVQREEKPVFALPIANRDQRRVFVYFSMPEDINISGVDAVAGASVVVRDGEKLGNTQYVAQLIQETIGGDLFRIETVQQYPLDHDPLVDQASDEKAERARPELSTHIDNLEQYDTVLLGYPNWWGDLPMPLYSFLEWYDLNGKTVIPFVTHGGSRASRTIETISQLQPDASI